MGVVKFPQFSLAIDRSAPRLSNRFSDAKNPRIKDLSTCQPIRRVVGTFFTFVSIL